MGSFNYNDDDKELDEYGQPIEPNKNDTDPSLADIINNAITDDVEYFKAKNKEDIDYFNAQNQADIDAYNDTSPYEYYYDDEEEDEEGIEDTLQKGKDLAEKFKKTPNGGGGDWFSRLAGSGKSAGTRAATKAGGAAVKGAGGSAVAAALPIIGWALLIILILIVIITIVVAISSFFENKTDPTNMTTNKYITSEYFYGIRSVYIDDEALSNSLQLSYKQYAVDMLEYMDDITDISINITLPIEFDNLTEIDQHITNISLAIGNIVANGSSNYNVEFSSLYPNIQYFGLTTEQGAIVNTFLADYITTNNIITNNSSTSVSDLVTQISSYQTMKYMYNVCEKVMIKDEIATDEGLSGIQQRQYIASIYMPNKNIIVTSSSYTVVNQNENFTTNVKLVELNNGTETIHIDETLEDDTEIMSNSKNITLNHFNSIDTNNLEAFAGGLSLFEALKSLPIGVQCFTQNVDTGIHSWQPVDESLLYLTFEASNKFIYTEFDLDVKLAD